jgi:hypothetical protein
MRPDGDLAKSTALTVLHGMATITEVEPGRKTTQPYA